MNRLLQKGRCPVKCSDARHLIHLSVGDDNLPDEEQALGEHLHTCSDCRAYSAGMVDAMQILHNFRYNTVITSDRSVWRSVIRRIEDRRSFARTTRLPRREFHGGIVALCALSLVLAFVTIVQNLPVNESAPLDARPVKFVRPVIPQFGLPRPGIRGTVPLNPDGTVRLPDESATSLSASRHLSSEAIPMSDDQLHF